MIIALLEIEMSKKNIDEIPDIPEELIKASEEGTLVIFIGAGVSRIMGCASWDSLSYNLLTQCYDLGIINYTQREHILKYNDNKKKITICQDLLKKSDHEDKFRECMEKALEGNTDIIEKTDIYFYLNKFSAIYITTNADELFDNHIVPKANIIDIDRISTSIKTNHLYHIHGKLKGEKIVFRASEYISAYNNVRMVSFLEKLFTREYTLLFIGYGLNEFELLDYIIGKSYKGEKMEMNKFSLEPYRSNERDLVNIDELYYKDLGINIVPYNYDEKGYNQLFHIIKAWSEKFSGLSNYPIHWIKNINSEINNFDYQSASEIVKQMKDKDYLSKEFFRLIKDVPEPQEWFSLLKKNGFFNPNDVELTPIEKKNGFYITPIWNAMDYIELISKKDLSKKELNSINKILKDIIEYIRANNIDNYIIYSGYISIIGNLPINFIYKYQIANISNFFNSHLRASHLSYNVEGLLGKLLKSKKSDFALILIDSFMKYKKERKIWSSYESNDIVPNLRPYDLERMITVIYRNIRDKDYIKLIHKLIDLIEKLEDEKSNVLNYIWIPTIENHEQTSHNDKFEIQVVKLLRDILLKTKTEEIRPIIERMFSKKGSVLRRISVYVIDKKYKKLNKILWEYNDNPLDETLDKHELYELFKNNAKSLSNAKISKIIHWIESKSYDYILDEDISNDIKNIKIAYRKKEWLSSIIESKDKRVQELYNKYDIINDYPIDHPGFLSWSGGAEWEDQASKSPFGEEQLLRMDNAQIHSELKSYDPKDEFNGPTKENFAWVLRACVSKEPEKFSKSLELFKDIEFVYINALLSGFLNAADNNEELDWKDIFSFISTLIKAKIYLKYKYKSTIMKTVSDIIKQGSNSESYGFGEKLLNISEEILFGLYSDTIKQEYENTEGLYVEIINDEQYQIFEAMIYISLKDYRIYNGGWREKIKKVFDINLNNNNYPVFFYSIGHYMWLLNYLDINWLKDNQAKLFNQNNSFNWYAIMSGIFSAGKAYKSVYKLMKEDGNIDKALTIKFDDQFENRHVQHIAIAYMNNVEDINTDGSTIDYMFELGNKDQLMELFRTIIRVEWKEEDPTQKIEDLIYKLYETFNGQDNYNELFVELILLFKYIKDINKFEHIIKHCVNCFDDRKYIEMKKYIEFCDIIKDDYQVLVLDTLTIVADKQITFNNEDELIIELLDKLYLSSNNTTGINQVCKLFIENGKSNYVSVYEKHNK